jgi:cephalosporin hydroxylase
MNMDPFQKEYERQLISSPDIAEHLPRLNQLARECRHVTEFGVRWGSSTAAFLNSDATLRSYDIVEDPSVAELFRLAQDAGKDARYIIASSLEIGTLEETDMLFIDSKHTYQQASAELKYANSVRKYIVLHDTTTFGTIGEDGSVGLWPAVVEFLAHSTDWTMVERLHNNNGLTVMARRSS